MPTEINRTEVRKLIDSGAQLIEVLPAQEYETEHLPGAINIPPHEVDRLAPRLLPDLDAEIVVYCSGACRNSEAAASRLEQLGYRRVLHYPGGKEDWIEHGLPVERAVCLD